MKTNWIPTSERLPEESGKVLVCLAYGCINVVNYSVKHRKFNNYDDCPEFPTRAFENVVAWMPLPEPYKEDGENES